MSTITHELRTPLTSIRAFSEILLDDPGVDPVQRTKFLDIISKEAERLTRLINQVLDLAKIESGGADWRVARVDVNDVVTDTLGRMSQVFKDRNIIVDARLPETLPAVSADPDRLVQVLMNLLSNAVKFCAPGRGRIDVAVSQRGRNVRVDVRDNGAGIPVANQALIFEKFRQAGDTMTSKPPGTGLGLHISRQIIDHFGGRLWVESRPGEGACFSFTLPCEPAEADVGVG
jgi:signal transduction histidine kinase